ncbi:unnamed protein product [Dovyalis caffra]|uniref:Uncharacterized protein n=1 Tax=Dovyalis caffra TaxID=77055 RepID=A0AAV1RN88_9ROSI|nr:unnamed protein product [Dovyalis caffra]
MVDTRRFHPVGSMESGSCDSFCRDSELKNMHGECLLDEALAFTRMNLSYLSTKSSPCLA